jgi:hypothetical protein
MRSLRASVAVVDPRVGVSYAVPIAAVDYVDLAVSARLDASGRYRYIQEVVAVVDGTAFVLYRSTADLVGMVDTKTISTLKNLSNSVELQDSLITLLLILRTFADNVALVDTDNRLYSLPKTEQVAIADNDFIDWAKSLAHSVTPEDVSAVSAEKPFSESFAATDAKALIFAAARVESATVTDVGIVSIQDYCDLGYFAEDYVGLSQSF